MPDAAQLAQSHWNETPLLLTEEERYSTYRWLYEVAEFRKHPGGRFNVHVYAFCSYFTLWCFLRYGREWKSHIEDSEAPLQIDLYTGRELRQLFGSGISIEKHQCKPLELLAPWFGRFFVVKGQKT